MGIQTPGLTNVSCRRVYGVHSDRAAGNPVALIAVSATVDFDENLYPQNEPWCSFRIAVTEQRGDQTSAS